MIGEILKFNASKVFLVKPIVGESLNYLEGYQIINSYLRDRDREDLDGDKLFVLFQPSDWEDFEAFLHQQKMTNNNYIEDYDYDGGYVVVVYEIPDFLLEDFEKFKEGRYSQFNTSTKRIFPKLYRDKTGKEKKTIQWRVFDKDNTLREELEEYVGEKIDRKSELFKAPGEEEILDISHIRSKERLLI